MCNDGAQTKLYVQEWCANKAMCAREVCGQSYVCVDGPRTKYCVLLRCNEKTNVYHGRARTKGDMVVHGQTYVRY